MRESKAAGRFLKGAVCAAVAVLFAGFGNTQTADAEKVNITAESGSWESVQSVLNEAAADSQNSYVIKVPKGHYEIDRKITVYSNTTLDLRGVTYKKTNVDRPILIFGDGTKGGYQNARNITIIGGTLDSGTASNSSDICLFSHAENITFRGTVFKYLPKKKYSAGMRNTHMIEFAAAKNVVIKNCKFYNNSNCSPNNEAVQIESVQNEQNLINSTPDLGKRDGTQCKNITITGCYFKGFQYGCGSNHLSKKDHYINMKFTNNTFVGAKKYAICLFGYRNVLISGNKLINCGSLYQNQGATGVKVKQ